MIVDLLVLGSCIIIVWDSFRTMPRAIWVVSMIILVCSANVGFIYHFQDSGASGPLPFEWLNDYYKFTLPLIATSLLFYLFKWKSRKNN